MLGLVVECFEGCLVWVVVCFFVGVWFVVQILVVDVVEIGVVWYVEDFFW